tara:strand:- start:361 stop:606 length:246 start_codon:yes stop_codon:yes gene_type:complete
MQRDLYRFAKARRDNEFIDYDPKDIAAKLKQVEDFEAKYGANDMSKSWRKWCNSHEYRRREWLWRQNLAAANQEIYVKKIY